MASNTAKKRLLQTESDDDTEQNPHFVFKGNDSFARFLVIKSEEEKAVTSLSPFVIEKQMESIIGTPKSVKKLKNKTLLVETSRKSQTENLLKISTFFGLSAPCHPGGRNRWLLCACSRWVRPPLYNATVRYTVPSNSLKQQKSIIKSLFFHTYRSNV